MNVPIPPTSRLPAESIRLHIYDREVVIDCSDADLRRIIEDNFDALRAEAGSVSDPLPLRFQVHRPAGTSDIDLIAGEVGQRAADPGNLLFLLEKSITLALQRSRSDLYFLHAAALAFGRRACLFAGDSGAGKSTLAWGLAHEGFAYLSDELAAVDLQRDVILPYPHALALKRRPAAYPLPQSALDLGGTIHVPARALPGGLSGPCPLAAIVFVEYRAGFGTPDLRIIGAAEAAARLYTVALNALAHPSRGLDAATTIVRRARCYLLASGELRATAHLVRAALVEGACPPGAVP